MNASKRNEKSQVPDGVQSHIEPHEPMQRDALAKSRHGHSRSNAARRRMFRRIPTNPDHFPTATRLPMLQPFAGPCDRVPLHRVMWACVKAAALQAGRHETAKEVLTWYEAV